MRIAIFLLVFVVSAGADKKKPAYKQIEFASGDGLKITADLYLAHTDPKTPFLVLCHQARWSRGEYREIAPKLNKLGFNCMAIDQRSGMGVNHITNETAVRAVKAKKGTLFLDARQDIVAALKYARSKHAKGKLIAWGSSYSAALVLELVGRDSKLADGVLSFAPGEYFTRFGKSGSWVREGASGLKCPVFITSAKNEHRQWKAIYDAIPSKKKASYLPNTAGNHGSRALWERFEDHKGYWDAVTKFLKANFLKS